VTKEISEFIALTLDPQTVSHIAYESVYPDSVEILPYFSKPDPLIYQIALALRSALESDELGSGLYADSMAVALSAHLLQNFSRRKHIIQDYQGGLPRHKLQQIVEFIIEHLSENLLLKTMAEEIGMSQYHFARLFKQSTGLSPYQYVIYCRIERAKTLLLRGQLKISEVSSLVGFHDQSQFTRHFKRLLGITPREFRN
jgi:AraC family transcriptional regulator